MKREVPITSFGPNHNITYVAHRGGGRGGGRDCNTRPQFTRLWPSKSQLSQLSLGTLPHGPPPPPPHHMLTLLGLVPNGGHQQHVSHESTVHCLT